MARDLVSPPSGRSGRLVGDRSVGEIVGERLGRPVVERLVDPLIGGINAGDVDDLSAAATFPVLIAASHQSGSLMHRLGAAPGGRDAVGTAPGGGVAGLLVARRQHGQPGRPAGRRAGPAGA